DLWERPGCDPPGDDVEPRPALRVPLRQAAAEGIEVRRNVDVRGLEPALRAPDHAARDDRARRRGAAPVAARVLEGALEAGRTVRAGAQDAGGQRARLGDLAVAAEPIGAELSRAPVQTDEVCVGHVRAAKLWVLLRNDQKQLTGMILRPYDSLGPNEGVAMHRLLSHARPAIGGFALIFLVFLLGATALAEGPKTVQGPGADSEC